MNNAIIDYVKRCNNVLKFNDNLQFETEELAAAYAVVCDQEDCEAGNDFGEDYLDSIKFHLDSLVNQGVIFDYDKAVDAAIDSLLQ